MKFLYIISDLFSSSFFPFLIILNFIRYSLVISPVFLYRSITLFIILS